MPKEVLNVLMIDDEEDFHASLKNFAATKHRIILHNKTNLKDGIDEILRNRNISAVILDGKAPLKPGQAKGTEKTNFVFNAIDELNRIDRELNRHLPFCVLTAWYEQLAESLEGRGPVYDKKALSTDESQKNRLFADLKEQVQKGDRTQTRKKYREIFEFVDEYFDDGNAEAIITLLTKETYCSNNIANRITSLASIRRISEHLMDILWTKYLNKTHSELTQASGKRTKEIIEYFDRNHSSVTPKPVFHCVCNIYHTASTYGNHNETSASALAYYPSSYLVSNLTFGLLETILWAKKLSPQS